MGQAGERQATAAAETIAERARHAAATLVDVLDQWETFAQGDATSQWRDDELAALSLADQLTRELVEDRDRMIADAARRSTVREIAAATGRSKSDVGRTISTHRR